MISERERKRRIKAKQRAKIEAQTRANQEYWFARGKAEGKSAAAKEHADNLRAQEREANIALAKSLSLMIESTARAVMTFIGEGGLRP